MSRAEFSKAVKLAAWERADGRCEMPGCTNKGEQFDHINPCAFCNNNGLANCAVLCRKHHAEKTKRDIGAIAKSNRIRLRHAGIRKERHIRAWRNFSGEIVRKPARRDPE